VSVVQQVEPKVQDVAPITDKDWDCMTQMVDEDVEARGEVDVEARGDVDSERILTQIMWDYFDEIRRSERQQAQAQAEQMSPEEVERLERLFNEANSDDE
jgi:hypothetical protein